MSVEAAGGGAQPAVNPDEIEVAEGQEPENLHGWVPDLADENLLCAALDKAFDYRGNITLSLHDGRKLEGYVFDRHRGADLNASYVRIIPTANRVKIKLAYADVRSLEFTGKDTAAGKSFESWVTKYWAKKAAGEKDIQIVPEALD
jgi:hypothetical protein